MSLSKVFLTASILCGVTFCATALARNGGYDSNSDTEYYYNQYQNAHRNMMQSDDDRDYDYYRRQAADSYNNYSRSSQDDWDRQQDLQRQQRQNWDTDPYKSPYE